MSPCQKTHIIVTECSSSLLPIPDTDTRLRLWQSDIPRGGGVPASDWSLVTLLSSHWLLTLAPRPPLTWPSAAQSSLSSRAFLSWSLMPDTARTWQMSVSWILIGQLLFLTPSHWLNDLVLSQDTYAEGDGFKVAIFILQTEPGVSVTGYRMSFKCRLIQTTNATKLKSARTWGFWMSS